MNALTITKKEALLWPEFANLSYNKAASLYLLIIGYSVLSYDSFVSFFKIFTIKA